MSDYQAARDHVEAAFLRAELEAVPGNWHLAQSIGGDPLTARDGKCCAISPVLLGRLTSGYFSEDAAVLLGVPVEWVNGVLNGFDSHPPSSSDPVYVDGYEWGQYMRRYIKPQEQT